MTKNPRTAGMNDAVAAAHAAKQPTWQIQRDTVAEADAMMDAFASIFFRVDRVIVDSSTLDVFNISDDWSSPVAATDGEHVYFGRESREAVINAIMAKVPEKGYAVLKGLNYHECFHIMFSPWGWSLDGWWRNEFDKLTSWEKQAFNILEDNRIEFLGVALYPTAAPYLVIAAQAFILGNLGRNPVTDAMLTHCRYHIDLDVRKAIYVHAEQFEPDWPNIAAFIEEYIDLNPFDPDQAKRMVEIVQEVGVWLMELADAGTLAPADDKGIFDSHERGMEGRTNAATAAAVADPQAQQDRERAQDAERKQRTDDAIKNAEEAWESDEDFLESAYGDDDGEPADESSGSVSGDWSADLGKNSLSPADGGLIGDEDRAVQATLREITKPGVSKMGNQEASDLLDQQVKSIAAHPGFQRTLDKEMGAARRAIESGQAIPKRPGGVPVTSVPMADTKLRREVESLHRVIREIRDTVRPGWESAQSTGRLNVNAILNGRGVETDVFDRWTPGKQSDLSTEVVLLIDTSGSMGSDGHMPGLRKLVWTVSNSFKGQDVRFWCIGFNSDDTIILMPRDRDAISMQRMLDLRATGGTNAAPSHSKAARILRASKARQKFLFCLTDGQWADGPAAKKYVERCRALGAVTALFGMGTCLNVPTVVSLDYYGYDMAKTVYSAADLIPIMQQAVRRSMAVAAKR